VQQIELTFALPHRPLTADEEEAIVASETFQTFLSSSSRIVDRAISQVKHENFHTAALNYVGFNTGFISN